jgi:hypothetical protein
MVAMVRAGRKRPCDQGDAEKLRGGENRQGLQKGKLLQAKPDSDIGLLDSCI